MIRGVGLSLIVLAALLASANRGVAQAPPPKPEWSGNGFVSPNPPQPNQIFTIRTEAINRGPAGRGSLTLSFPTNPDGSGLEPVADKTVVSDLCNADKVLMPGSAQPIWHYDDSGRFRIGPRFQLSGGLKYPVAECNTLTWPVNATIWIEAAVRAPRPGTYLVLVRATAAQGENDYLGNDPGLESREAGVQRDQQNVPSRKIEIKVENPSPTATPVLATPTEAPSATPQPTTPTPGQAAPSGPGTGGQTPAPTGTPPTNSGGGGGVSASQALLIGGAGLGSLLLVGGVSLLVLAVRRRRPGDGGQPAKNGLPFGPQPVAPASDGPGVKSPRSGRVFRSDPSVQRAVLPPPTGRGKRAPAGQVEPDVNALATSVGGPKIETTASQTSWCAGCANPIPGAEPIERCAICRRPYHKSCFQRAGCLNPDCADPTHWGESLIGRTLADRYRIKAMIGGGGMAQVYRAEDLHRQADVALKLMHADLADDPQFVERFRHEARALAELQHPNIVRLYELVQDQDRVFLVIDYASGGNLAQRLRAFHRQGQRLTVGESVRVVAQIGRALAYAHRAGYVHRDVKPANILFADPKSDRVLLSDLGIVKYKDEVALTQSGLGVGTAQYMAPEQAAGQRDIDGRADIYALGVTLWEMLAGRRPFLGDRSTVEGAVYERILDEQRNLSPPPLRPINPAVSPELEAVVLRALAKDRADRWPTAEAFVQVVEAAPLAVITREG